MTGRIEVLATANKPGRITTHSGASMFHYVYRSPVGKMDGLAPGSLVSFELEGGSVDSAVDVCLKQPGESPSGTRRAEIRYEGFEQTENIRTYQFQARQAGEENQGAVVSVDLDLFRKHGIGIQEGPGLCLRLLERELQESRPSRANSWKRRLDDKEMLAHLADKAISKKKRF